MLLHGRDHRGGGRRGREVNVDAAALLQALPHAGQVGIVLRRPALLVLPRHLLERLARGEEEGRRGRGWEEEKTNE